MNDKLHAAHDKLQEAVAEIVSGDEWKRMLAVAAKFHNYSGGGITYSNSLNSPALPFVIPSASTHGVACE